MNLSTHNITKKFKNKVEKEKAIKRKKFVKNLTGSASVFAVIILLASFIITKAGIGIKNSDGGTGNGSNYTTSQGEKTTLDGNNENSEDTDLEPVLLDSREWYYENDMYTVRWEGNKAYWYSILQQKDLALLWEENNMFQQNISKLSLENRESYARAIVNTKQMDKKYTIELGKLREFESVAVTEKESGLYSESYVEERTSGSDYLKSEQEKIKAQLGELESAMESAKENNSNYHVEKYYTYLPNDCVDMEGDQCIMITYLGTLFFAVGNEDGTAAFYKMDINGDNKVMMELRYNMTSENEVYNHLVTLVKEY